MIDSTLIHVNNANSTDDVTINQSMTTPVHESALDIAIDTHVNGNINDEASDIAGSSSQDPEPVPDEPRVDLIPAGDVALKTDVEMVDSNSLSIVTPPSPAPSGVSQPINELSLNDISRSSPSYSAPISPSTAHASAPNGHLALFAPHRERRVDDSHATTDEHRPAKRARTADVTSPPSTQKAPASPPTPPPTHTTISPAQFKFVQSTLRSVRKNKDAGPFNQAVDPSLLGIPHYPNIVKRPMDFSIIDARLAASNPSKPDPSHNVARYSSVQEFIADMKLVFDNCFLFNGPDHVISQCAKRLQAVFERSLKNMPPPQAPTPLFKAPTPAPAPPPAPEPKKVIRRPSASVPTIRRSDEATATEFAASRPRREIHPPPPKDLDYAEPASTKRPKLAKLNKNTKRKDDGTLEQLRYCSKIVNELYKKQHASYANFFYDPVDVRQVPNYYKLIKSPMDLSTLKRKLEHKEYPDSSVFLQDWKLMMKNCVTFNPVGTMVYVAGQDMQRVFEEKWKGLPPLHTPPPSEDEDEEPTVQSSMIESLESQLNNLRDTIDALKSTKKKVNETKRSTSSAPKASSSASRSRPSTSAKKASSSAKKTGARKLDADAILSFEEKKELSETIQSLDGHALEEVIQIIHDGVPEIGDNADEIEIEIDALPPAVLRQLWNTVIKPKPGAPSTKTAKSGKNHPATGGVKRKSMDEHVEAQRMRALEARINMFDKAETNGVQKHHGTATVAAHDSGSDSESDSGSESSDSD